MGLCRQFVAESFSKLPGALNTLEISPTVRRGSAGLSWSSFRRLDSRDPTQSNSFGGLAWPGPGKWLPTKSDHKKRGDA
jgi:hypothetical protein